ncbi:MAG TPA: UbiA family prenyltransferase, partial [Chloroflexota bacterium]|nr:UbiA family prenyltransferase [Chloroflexota bacterium]
MSGVAGIATAVSRGERARLTESLHLLLRSARPRQWPKNAVVLLGLVFARYLFDPVPLSRAVLAMLLFCIVSVAVYLVNDLLDAEKDRLHPVKSRRPIASGRLSPTLAWITASVAGVGGLVASFLLAPGFGAIVAGYLALQAAYVGFFKHAVILDVLILASGFVLRAIAGAVVIGVPISPWLYVCTMLLALFLALGKRRQELVLLSGSAGGHRPSLD